MQAIGTSPGAGASVGPMGWFDPSSQIATIAAGWLPQAQAMAQKVYGILFVIELFMLGLQTILFRDNLGEFFSGLAFKVFTAGFFIWLINDAVDIFTVIIGSFNQAGQAVSGASKSTLSTLYGQEGGAVTLFLASMTAALVGSSMAENLCPAGASGCVSAISTIAMPLAVICGGMAILIFSSLLVLSLTYILITIETMIVMCGGVFFLGFAALRFTMPFSQGYLRYAINVGVKLFAFWLIVGIEGPMMPGVLANAGLTAGATAIGAGITALIVATSTTSVAAADAADTAKVASLEGALGGADTTALATMSAAATAEAATATSPGDMAGLGTAMATVAAGPKIAEDTALAAAEGPADAAGSGAAAAAVGAGTAAVTAAAVTAFTAVMFAAFGALQVIVLNALASAVPTLASSLTSGSSLLSAQETLKGVGTTLAEAGAAAGALVMKMNSAVSASRNSQAKTVDGMRSKELTREATEAVVAPSSDPEKRQEQLRTLQLAAERTSTPPATRDDLLTIINRRRQQTPTGQPAALSGASGTITPAGIDAVQPPVAPVVQRPFSIGNSVGGITPAVAPGSGQQSPTFGDTGDTRPATPVRSVSSITPASSIGGAPHHVTGSAPPPPINPQTWQETLAHEQYEDARHASWEKYGLAGLTNQERNALSPLKRAKLISAAVNGEHAMTPEVQAWIAASPDHKALWKQASLEKRRRESAASNASNLRGLIFVETLSSTTHHAKEGGSPGFGDSGMKGV
jgi:P-type conjugative transfer protein TrbL